MCIEGDKGLVCMAGDKDLCLWKVCVWKETVCMEGDYVWKETRTCAYGRRQGLVCMEGDKDLCVWKETRTCAYGRRQGLVCMEGGKWNYTVRIIEWVVMEIMRLS